MIDGLLLLIELCLFLLLLWAVRRAGRQKSEEDLGFFAYKADSKNADPKQAEKNKPLKRGNFRA